MSLFYFIFLALNHQICFSLILNVALDCALQLFVKSLELVKTCSNYDMPMVMHSAAACIYGKNFFWDFMLIFEKFRLFYDVETHF